MAATANKDPWTMKLRLLSTFVLVAVRCGANASGQATAPRRATNEGAAAASGRKRQLRRPTDSKKDQPRAQDVELAGRGPCRSIIAVGGWRAPSERQLQHDDGDLIISTDDDGVLNDDFVDFDAGVSGIAPIRRDPIDGLDFLTGDIDYIDDGDVVIPYEGGYQETDTDEDFVCELQDGSTLPIQGTYYQIAELRTMLNSGTLISAESSVETDQISSGGGNGNGDAISSNAREFVTLPPGSITVIDNDEDDSRRRRLNMYEGKKKLLVVKVYDKEKRAVPESAAVISDKFFGTTGDPVTPKRGFNDCSFGEFQTTNDYGGAIDESKLSAPGVVEVTINAKLRHSTQQAVRNKAVVAVQQKLGLRLPGPFDHVAFVVEKCFPNDTSCAASAYAFVNHWLSLYFGKNYKYPAVVMHEMGHNLNFAHSGGLDGRTYTDHTCLMGNPLWKDNVGRMCFNPVKNYQLAMAGSWYSDEYIQVFDSGTAGGTSWSGRLIGVAEYNNNPDSHSIVVKLETGSGSDWFLGFNRAVGANSHNVQADDRVTLYKVAAGHGAKYSNSFLKAALRGLQRATIGNWRQSGLDLVINVYEINTSVSPGYADVEITFGPQTTPSPSREPTHSPSKMATVQPTFPPSISPTTVATTKPPSTKTATTENGVAFFNSGTLGGTSWAGTLVEIHGSDASDSPHTIIMEYDDESRWFVQFNAMHVTIFQWKDGIISLKGALLAGESETVENWRNSGLDLVVSAQEIDTNAISPFARVEILFGDQLLLPNLTAWPTINPTSDPTRSPSHLPSVAPSLPPTSALTVLIAETVRGTSHPPTTQPSSIAPATRGIAFFDSGTEGGTSWSGTLVEIHGMETDTSTLPHTIVLEYDDNHRWFVQFNAMHVTVFQWNNGDISLEGALLAGQSEIIPNWRDSGQNLVVNYIQEVDGANDSKEFAHVEILFGPQPLLPVLTAWPTVYPTLGPTPPPTTKQPTPSPTQDPQYTMFPYPYPHKRFTKWNSLSNTDKVTASSLGYQRSSWDNLQQSAVETYPFSELDSAEQVAVQALGMDEDSWNCFMNYYSGFWWSEMEEEGVAQYYEVLGWSRNSWDNGAGVPDTESMSWDELSASQQEAAHNLCYFQNAWNSVPLPDW